MLISHTITPFHPCHVEEIHNYANYKYIVTTLLVLCATATSLLCSLNALLVSFNLTTLHSAHEASGCLKWSLELATRWLAEEVDLDQVSLESALDWDDALDEERVCVLKVDVHDGHHADTHELCAEEGLELLLVVGVNGGGDGLWLLGGTHWGWLDVFEDGHVWMCVSRVLQNLWATDAGATEMEGDVYCKG
jgi:hypothetical protein